MTVLGIDLGPHWAVIVTAYALAALVLAGLVAWIVLDNRLQRRTLADLDRRGVRRRSSGRTTP